MTLKRVSIAAMVVAGSVPALPQTPSSVWTLTASISPAGPRASLALNAVLRNQSAATLKVIDRTALADFRVAVTDESGALVPYTEHAKALIDAYEKGAAFRADVVEVDPGKEFRKAIELSGLYGDLKPGKYSVKVERVGWLQVSQGGRPVWPKEKELVSPSVAFELRK